ncbi:uncharacterized protein LOC111796239 isoform X1 [Cucurbita pepo subsp. pepo]|uniref:uncharacterized protein LOC111796239 isoform X1 n=2 Tax=Cucurbita pepo subsp. pepo TaxID=3664 RepID=UPI000C9D7BC8|nr:uncharacterized protein LOC111796239 isoform X1 [Cucurbita pepo subsp. pepo]
MLGEDARTGHTRSKRTLLSLLYAYGSSLDKKAVQDDPLHNSLQLSNIVNMDMDQVKEVENKKNLSPKMEVHSSLKNEIIQLEKRLQDQFKLRSALEKALNHGVLPYSNSDKISMPKSAMELITEIATLELEVVHLEQYLLSLYRKAFEGQSSSVSPAKDEMSKLPSTPKGRSMVVPLPDIASKDENSAALSGCQSLENPSKDCSDRDGKLSGSNFYRSQSSLTTSNAASLDKASASVVSLDRTLRACHSQPVSMMEYAQNVSSNIISLAEHLGTCISDHVPETPNRLSEDMIKCISAIYCKLAEPSLSNHGLSSPMSSLSSISEFSPGEQYAMCSPGFRNNSSFDRLDNPFLVEGLKDFSGPYSTMIEISRICGDPQKLHDVKSLLENFRLLISRLEKVDLRKLKYEEKLAFWINIHNSLVMHTYLAYGVPQNNIKRAFLLLKSAYNIGGHTISVDTIQSCILGCRMPRPWQWLRLLLPSRTKLKIGDERQAYMIDRPEPRLHFSLCYGSHSDPAVRVYTPKRMFQELESAKDDYIRANFGVRKDQKILLPKIVESFAKDSGLCSSGLMEMILKSLPESLRKSVKRAQLGNPRKNVEWIAPSYTFRYLISKELTT